MRKSAHLSAPWVRHLKVKEKWNSWTGCLQHAGLSSSQSQPPGRRNRAPTEERERLAPAKKRGQEDALNSNRSDAFWGEVAQCWPGGRNHVCSCPLPRWLWEEKKGKSDISDVLICPWADPAQSWAWIGWIRPSIQIQYSDPGLERTEMLEKIFFKISVKQPEAKKISPNSCNQKEELSLGREAWCAILSFLESMGTFQMQPGVLRKKIELQLVSEISKWQAFHWMGAGFRTKTPYIFKDKVMMLATSVLHLCLYIIFSFIPSSHFVKDLEQLWKSLMELVVKNLPANAGDIREAGSIPGSGSWFHPWVWRRAWQPTPVFLPGESHRQRSPTGSQRVRQDWSNLTGTQEKHTTSA